MATEIWKWSLKPGKPVEMPRGAQILSAQAQHGELCIWAAVDPSQPTETRHFNVVGTGCPFNMEHQRYIGTAQLEGGFLVLHVFEAVTTPTGAPARDSDQ